LVGDAKPSLAKLLRGLGKKTGEIIFSRLTPHVCFAIKAILS
jgi:hypothetical protein